MPLPATVASTISRHRMFQGGERVGVAVSGGADSIALLYALVELAPRWNLRLSVAHFDHQLRGEESCADADFTAEMAAKFGLPFHLERTAVACAARASRDNLEQTARRLRRAFFARLRSEGSVDLIATGHTQSDQAETVLFRLLRGTGMTGLAGILPATAEGLVRPLLDVTREDVREWLTALGVSWREDSTNSDRAFRRNRIRLELLPALQRDWNPALAVALAQLGEIAAEEESWWRSEIARVAGELISEEPRLGLLINAPRLSGLHPALARRMLRFVVERAKGDGRRISFRHIEALYDLARRHSSGKIRLPGLEACRSFDWILLGAPYARPPSSEVALTVPGSHRLDDGTILRLDLVSVPPYRPVDYRYTYTGNDLDWDLVKVTGLCCRPWRPGDRYRLLALNREEKLKGLFQRARVPLWKRHLWPIIRSGDAIAWARQFGVAADFAVTANTTTVLRVSEPAQS